MLLMLFDLLARPLGEEGGKLYAYFSISRVLKFWGDIYFDPELKIVRKSSRKSLLFVQSVIYFVSVWLYFAVFYVYYKALGRNVYQIQSPPSSHRIQMEVAVKKVQSKGKYQMRNYKRVKNKTL
ncbi:hypothetical protein K501DRAFT_279254 [Backusella circina FSU 941]|nr:hypothetical protein K501DRAFT_279254 [Backusella circina FSU 941]